MGAPKGNQFWKARTTYGREKRWSPEELRNACYEYFQWVEENPLREAIVFRGKLSRGKGKPIMRPMTIGGLCIFLGCTRQTWINYGNHKDYLDIVQEVNSIIYEQKFAGAAAGLLNPNIIARDLGLAEKSHVGATVSSKDLSDEDLDKEINSLLSDDNS